MDNDPVLVELVSAHGYVSVSVALYDKVKQELHVSYLCLTLPRKFMQHDGAYLHFSEYFPAFIVNNVLASSRIQRANFKLVHDLIDCEVACHYAQVISLYKIMDHVVAFESVSVLIRERQWICVAAFEWICVTRNILHDTIVRYASMYVNFYFVDSCNYAALTIQR